jgi:anti-anti-sigma factor
LAQLKNDEKLKNIPVVLFSGEAITDSDRAVNELKVVGILQKPLIMEALLAIFSKISGEQPPNPGAGDAPAAVKTSSPQSEGAQRIVVERNMTGAFVNELEKRFLEKIKNVHSAPIVLDLTDVSVIDSRGVALCIGLKKECDGKGAKFSIDTNPELFKMFKLFKLTQVIDMKEVIRP